MNKYNTQLPQVNLEPPQAERLFTLPKIFGYLFLILSFLLAVLFIYQMKFGAKPEEAMSCIQVITSARNLQTGEVRDFPTPCDVPEGWEKIRADILPVPSSQSGPPAYDLKCDVDNRQCKLSVNSGNESTSLIDLPTNNRDLLFQIIGWNEEMVVVEGAEPDLCAGYRVVYEVNLTAKKLVELDSTDGGCQPDHVQSQDIEKYESLLKQLQSDLTFLANPR